MGLVSQQITNILGGVSQAPVASRNESEWTEQINAFPRAKLGLTRRPPSVHTAVLDSTDLSGAFVQRLGAYNVVVASGAIKVFHALTGLAQTVIVKSGLPYVAAAGVLKGIAVDDTAFILNTGVTAMRGGAVSSVVVYEAYVPVRQGDYSTKYSIVLNGQASTVTTNDNTGAAAAQNITTLYIAQALRAAILANVVYGAAFTVDIYGSTLRIARADGADFTVATSDGIGDKALVPIKGAAQEFADLPETAKPGSIVAIIGNGTSAFTTYYVQYISSGIPTEKGTWREVTGPAITNGLLASTLPIRIAKNGDLFKGSMAVRPPNGSITSTAFSKMKFTVLDNTVYPKGTEYDVAVYWGAGPFDFDLFVYTVTGETETANTIAAALKLLVDAHVNWVATVSGNTVEVENTIPATAPKIVATPAFDVSTHFWSPDVTMVPNEHAGKTLYNLTTGRSAVIVSNSVNVIITTYTTGDLYTRGDVCVVRGAGTYFLVEQCPWSVRSTGDETTSPSPSFCGRTITDLFVHQGRLGFVYGANVALSRAGDLYTFWRKTATAILASDPIYATGIGASSFHSAVEWNDAMYLWTEKAQYVLVGEPVLTPTTVGLTKVSEYHNVATVRPVVAGQRVFFVALHSGFLHLMDYHTKGYQKVHEASDVGQAIPTYLTGTPRSLVADESLGIVVVNTDTNAGHSLFCYSYAYEADQLVLSAWGRWNFGAGNILAMDIVDGVLMLIQGYTAGTCLNAVVFDAALLLVYENVSLFNGAGVFIGVESYDGGPNIVSYNALPAYLDRHVRSASSGVTAVFAAGVTTWTLPYAVSLTGTEGVLAVCLDNPSDLLVTTRPSATSVAAIGDYTAQDVHIGVLYDSKHTLSTLFVRNKGIAETRGRLQLRWLRVGYKNLTSITVTVATPGRADRTYTVASRILKDGEFLVPILERNTDSTLSITTGSAGADVLVDYSWEGTHHTRERAL